MKGKRNMKDNNKNNNKIKMFIIVAVIICLIIGICILIVNAANTPQIEPCGTPVPSNNLKPNKPISPADLSNDIEDFTLKPIIYLYPTEETDVSVNLKNKDMITVSYPKYKFGWNVRAKEDGTLVDLETNRSLYSLYYEFNNTVNYKVEDEGFVVKGEDVAEFLEEKLAILGLTEREAEEFIIYWLPKLEANKYNYIRFATAEEIEQNMPLEITPKPDTTIRIIMTFKGLDSPIQVKEQKLEQAQRNGFVAVEWGGTEIK